MQAESLSLSLSLHCFPVSMDQGSEGVWFSPLEFKNIFFLSLSPLTVTLPPPLSFPLSLCTSLSPYPSLSSSLPVLLLPLDIDSPQPNLVSRSSSQSSFGKVCLSPSLSPSLSLYLSFINAFPPVSLILPLSPPLPLPFSFSLSSFPPLPLSSYPSSSSLFSPNLTLPIYFSHPPSLPPPPLLLLSSSLSFSLSLSLRPSERTS